MLSIGAIQSALDWFLALDMWEECVACYNTQGYRHKVNYRDFMQQVIIISILKKF